MYSIGIAASILGVCIKTIRRWELKKKICCMRTLGGHRRISVDEIRRLLLRHRKTPSIELESPNLKCAIYARVSSHKQSKRGDLDRQIEALKRYALLNHLCIVKVYKDIGSGLNTTRKGLWKLIRDGKKHDFSIVLLNFKDRLTRFGYMYLKSYLLEFNISLLCINKLDDKSPESELVEDLVAIIHSFSGKLYRMRRTEQGKN